MSKLQNLKRNKGATKAKKVVGRGNGSGHGTYSTRGGKGQTARSGGTRRPGFIGGQTPTFRKMPKLGGFTSINRIEFQVINLGQLEKNFKEGDTVTVVELHKKSLVPFKNRPVKLLGDGEFSKKLTIKLSKVSESAMEKLKKAGSSFEEVKPHEMNSEKSEPATKEVSKKKTAAAKTTKKTSKKK